MDANQFGPQRTAAAELARLEQLLVNIEIGYEEFEFLYSRREVTDVLRATAEGSFRIYFNVMLDWLIVQLGKLHGSGQGRAVTLDSALRRLRAEMPKADFTSAQRHADAFARAYQQYCKLTRDRVMAHMDWEAPQVDIPLNMKPLIDAARRCMSEMYSEAGLDPVAPHQLPPGMQYRAPHLVALLGRHAQRDGD